MSDELSQLHLADLHALAAERGIEGYRLLRREDLIARLEGGSTAPRRRRGRRGGRGRRERERLPAEGSARGGARRGAEDAEDAAADADGENGATEQVTGILELTRQRHGFIRTPGLGAREDDVYVSASQVRRCELRAGDEVAGPARAPRRGERHRALVHVDSVNGGPPQEEGRVDFDELTPEPPSRRIELAADAGTLARAVDLLAPLAYGQRVLIRSVPRSGRTTLLRELAGAVGSVDSVTVIVLLIDEHPEELPGWREVGDGLELAVAPADLAPREQVRIAELALARARRVAESGGDAVLICDSLSRLAVAADDVAEVKRLFGSGRALAEEGAGSLTVIATTFAEGEDEGSAERAVSTTETALVTLDPGLAERGVVPALVFAECRAAGEEALLGPDLVAGLRALRSELADLEPGDAAARVRDLIDESASNGEALERLSSG